VFKLVQAIFQQWKIAFLLHLFKSFKKSLDAEGFFVL